MKIMKAIVEKKTEFVDVNSKFTELVSTTYFLGIPIHRDSKKFTVPYAEESFEDKEIKELYIKRSVYSSFACGHLFK